jgi:hypothetical protein
MLKEWLREWLGINGVGTKEMERLRYEIESIQEQIQQYRIYHSTGADDVMIIDQKLDALAGLLGVEIVEDLVRNPREVIIKSIRDNGLLSNAREYVDAALTVEKLIAAQHKMNVEYGNLISLLNWRSDKTNGSRRS